MLDEDLIEASVKYSPWTVIGMWVALTGVYAYWTISSKLSLPPGGDAYAHTLGFQALQFIYFKLAALLLALVCAIAVQAVLYRIARSSREGKVKRLLRATLWCGLALAAVWALWHNATSTMPYNPYFQRDEQLLLQFVTTRLPLLGVVVGLLLAVEWRWLRRQVT